MRSMKLLAAMAVVAVLVAGPVMAQDTSGTMSPTAPAADAGKAKTVKHHHKKHKKVGSASTAPVTEGTMTPAK